MSWHTYTVYGEGHLATTLCCALETLGFGPVAASMPEPFTIGGEGTLAFVAQDVLDHGDSVALAEVKKLLSLARDRHQYVVVLSQVPPGWTRAAAGAQAHLSRVFYQVDTIIVRQAVARMVRPEQVVVGCVAPDEPLPLAYQEYLGALMCPVLQTSYESAELAKCAINYALAKQVEMARELAAAAQVCHAKYSHVAAVLLRDARIGPYAYLRPGEINQHLRRDVSTIAHLLAQAQERE